MTALELVITIDKGGVLHTTIEGCEDLLVPLIGGIELAKVGLIKRVREMNAKKTEAHIPIVPESVYHTEQEVNRDLALEATEYAAKCLEMRIKKMREAPSTATFRIDPDLLSRL